MIKLEPPINWIKFDKKSPPMNLDMEANYLIFLREDIEGNGISWSYSVDIATPYGSYLDDFWNTENDWREGQNHIEVLAYAELSYMLREDELIKEEE